MAAPKRESRRGRTGGLGYYDAKASGLHKKDSTPLPFRLIHWRPALYSLAIKDAAPGITQSLLVRAWSREIREALR